MSTDDKKALRYNTGKLRYDLIPEFALREVAKVLTHGAEKYTVRDESGKVISDGSNNWKKGSSWMSIMASTKRHLAAFLNSEDHDPETQDYHIAHAITNLLFVLEYYKIYPQGDDRPHFYLNHPKIGLDIDEVLADWVGHWTKYHKQDTPNFWNFDKDMDKKMDLLKDNKDFWLSIPPIINHKDLPFEPHCYITSRSIPKEWTEEWLQKNGFPASPVYSVPYNTTKVEVAKQSGVEWFVDDRYENFVELNKNGICCFLFNAPHNERYNVGYRRISSLKELVTYFK